jgi:NAD(P)-dependent dehydrogenase (short-subunit alcohol dehydrogenase family)
MPPVQPDDAFGLKGRVVIVAGGGGGGIGTAVCRFLHDAGARVAALDLEMDRLAPTKQVIGDDGRHLYLECDVRRPDQVAAAVDAAAEKLGPLYGLAHVAGGMVDYEMWQPTMTVSLESFRGVVELNLDALVLTSQAVARRLLAQGTPGSIVMVSSLSGVLCAPFAAAYGAAKSGVLSLTRTTAVEWGPLGIRVNAVAPGTIRTPRSLRTGSSQHDSDEERQAIPLGRRGRPEDIAGAVLFLLSELAAFVSGQTISVDGGSSAKPSYLDPIGLPIFVKDEALHERLRPAPGA